MYHPLFQLILMNLREYIRMPGVMFWSIGFPLLLSWILGITFTHKSYVKHQVAVTSIELLEYCKSKNSIKKYVNFTCKVINKEQAFQEVKKGKFLVVLHKEANKVNVYFDASNTNAREIYFILEQSFNKSKTNLHIKQITQSGLRYIDFLIPGLIALTIFNSCFWGTGWTLIELRVRKLLRRIHATPFKKRDFILAFYFVRIITGIPEFMFLFGFAYFYFQIQIQGSFLAILLLFFLANFCFIGITFLIVSKVNSTKVGNGVINAATLPMTILSGVFFNYQTLPNWAVQIIDYLPLSILTNNLRLLFYNDLGLDIIIVPCLILFTMGFLGFYFSMKIFKWY